MSQGARQFDTARAATLSAAELAHELLEQSFASEHGFDQLHLEEIETLFLETQTVDTGLPSTFDEKAWTSRDISLDYFCFLLFALDQSGSASSSSETLYELAGREQGTRILTNHGFKLPKTEPVSAEREPRFEAAQSAPEIENAALTQEVGASADSGSEFDGPFDPSVQIAETEAEAAKHYESSIPQDFERSEENLSAAAHASAEAALDPWAFKDDAIAPLWGDNTLSATPSEPDDVPEIETQPENETVQELEADPEPLHAEPEPEPAQIIEAKESAPVKEGHRTFIPPPPPPVSRVKEHLGLVKHEPAYVSNQVAASEPAAKHVGHSAEVNPLPKAPVSTPAEQAPSAKTGSGEAKKVTLEESLELEDNNWIEQQFAGIANQLASDTPLHSKATAEDVFADSESESEISPVSEASLEMPEENTASIIFDSESSGETKEIALAVAEEFGNAPLAEATNSEVRDLNAYEESSPGTEMPVPPVESPYTPAENTVVRTACRDAQEYLGVASFLESFLQQDNLSFPSHHLSRLSAQSLSHATEAEWMHKLGRGLERFWGDRKNAITDLLDITASPVRLHPVIKAAVDMIADSNRGILADEKFPHTAVVSSLQYLVSIENFEKAKLTLMDMGVLVFFFGADRTLGGLSLSNRLETVGLDPELSVELAFRLTRMHRLRSRSNSIRKEFSQADLLVLSQDAMRCLELLAGSHSEDSALHPIQVA